MRHFHTSRFLSFPLLLQAFLLCSLLLAVSCEKEESSVDEQTQEDAMNNEDDENSGDTGNEDMDEETDTGNQSNDCPDAIGFVFEEANGIVSIEFEDNSFPERWVLRNEGSDYSGAGYMQWEGNPSMGSPGNAMVTFPIRITNPGPTVLYGIPPSSKGIMERNTTIRGYASQMLMISLAVKGTAVWYTPMIRVKNPTRRVLHRTVGSKSTAVAMMLPLSGRLPPPIMMHTIFS